MRNLGWMERRDFLAVPSGQALYGLPQLTDDAARRVVGDKPDLVLSHTTAYALALYRATASIPIVMVTSGYPVECGLASSLAKPGKNVTGNTIYAGVEVWGKLLQLLREVKPTTQRVGILLTYVPPAFPREEIEPCYAEIGRAERLLGLKLHIAEAADTDQIPAALRRVAADRPDALLLAGGFTFQVVSSIMQLAVQLRLPTIVDFQWPTGEVEPYPLLSYAPVYQELIRSAADYVDKILKGASPANLPIQRPAKFEMSVNLKTAKAINLTVPQGLLLRADRVIE
jgi:ABC-type uncharacterized transport system substrate-binding protein